MNRASYDAIAETWDQHRVALSPLEAQVLPLVVEGLPPTSVVLDLGCGTGLPVAASFVAAGFRVVGVDQSTEMLAIATRRFPDQQWILATIEDFPAVANVGAVVAWDSMFHIPRERHAAIFARVRSLLAPGGRFALTVGGSEHPAFTDQMFGHTFFYDSYPPAQVAELLEASGFRLLHQSFLNEPDGKRDKGRVAMVAEAL